MTDADGASATGTTTVTVRNLAPVPTITSVSAGWLEGTAITATGAATDPAGPTDAVTLSWAVYKDGADDRLRHRGGRDLHLHPGRTTATTRSC